MEELAGFTPSAPSDGLFDFIRDDDGRIKGQLENSASVGDQRGGISALPADSAKSGKEGCGRTSSDGPPRAFGMRELVSGMVKGNLEVGGNHLSQTAMAQCRTTAACASKAGSSVPFVPSAARSVRMGFLPAAAGDAAICALSGQTALGATRFDSI